MGSPHFGPTHQGVSKAFVLKEVSSDKPPQISSEVYLPHLVGSLHYESAHQVIGEAFHIKKISSDKPPLVFSALPNSKVKGAYYAFLKNDLGHMATLATWNGLFTFAVHRFSPHYGVWKLSSANFEHSCASFGLYTFV